jgi:branched-chain amino acid transport system ATP-binding protein
VDAVLEVEKVSSGYGKNAIVKDVSLYAKPGSTSVIIGPNGAGKSTLLKAIFGLLPVFSGSVALKGQNVTGLAPERLVAHGMAYVPQNNNVFPSLTVQENLEIGAYLTSSTLKSKMEEVFTMFPDLKAAARRPAGTLSGGQRNMLAMGRALMTNPEVLLLDEPTAGLSPAYTKVVWEHIVEIAKLGKAVVVVEQNATTALSLANWGYLLVAGQNREEGPAAELLARPDIGKMFLGR